ncbi:PTS system N-acetylglucosamine-specific IIC component [Thermocatellispora tengchongensis]|uniref:PTS system N-acetylglucosamine-specific IIC component n=1 Tax=Thermocatellispora tengchongensis TaxID=1073253 RepID=A0A840P591_9ACTN|nr:PTS transporter subunit EIIC [Thermocatellispora tengchongensis]MBB5134838.1 PTS system N-acetylglucosamine-specific IIC component [Thermocatellispora tengchongensis]
MSSTSADAGLPAAPKSQSAVMAVLSRIGRSLMLPIAALPAAALLLRIGQDDLLGRTDNVTLDRVAAIVGGAGGALFDALPLLFAVGVAIGFARKADGSTALAAVVGYLVWDRVTHLMFFNSDLKGQVSQKVVGADGTAVDMINLASANPTRVLGGILIGVVTALLWQRYYRIKLPAWLAFFGGRRFVPMVTALAALVLGVIFGLIWPPIGQGLSDFGDWLATHSTIGAGIYGVVNRLLIPLGLHHFVNSIVWFTVPECTAGVNGATTTAAGDLNCYFAGNMGSGEFMAGFFPVMMFGLPAAALAIWHAAPPHRRAAIGGIMFSAALISFVTGITEPIEFAFIFVAPVLFIVHALLTGAALAITAAMDGWLGFGFSAGLIDAVLNLSKSNTNNFWLIMGLGVIYAILYYVIFSFLIRRLNIMTPGREPEPDVDSGESTPAKPGASAAT